MPDKTTTPKFTRGPWKYDDSQRYYSTRVIRWNGVVICNPVHQTTMSQAEYDANCRLMVAAPELFTALADCVESLMRLPDAEDAYRVTCINQAKAALRLVTEQSRSTITI